MGHVAFFKSIGLSLVAAIFLNGCPGAAKDASDTVTPQQQFARSMVGTWSYPECWIESTTNVFHRSWEDSFADDGTFKIVWSLFADSSCVTDPVARVTYFGKFTIGNEVEAPFQQNPGKKVLAREIDYRFDRFEAEGHRLLAQAVLSTTTPANFYDITFVDTNSRFDGYNGLVGSEAERSTQLFFEFKRTPGLSGRTAVPSPSLDTAPTVANLAGTWDDDCYEDGQSPGYFQSFRFTFAAPNTISVKSALWSTSDCTGTEKASVTFNGTFKLVDNVVTAVSQATAARMEFVLGAAVVAGDATLAAASLPGRDWENATYYHLVAYDATYDLILYGGWFESSLAALPTDVDSGMAKLGRKPLKVRLPRAARAGRG